MEKNNIKPYDVICIGNALPDIYIDPDYMIMTRISNGSSSYWRSDTLGDKVLLHILRGRLPIERVVRHKEAD